MLDVEALARLAHQPGYSPLFLTVSGAHLYGFPSPDSDIDLRGCHRLPLREALRLTRPRETLELCLDEHGTEVELVSHEVEKYLRLLLKSNGYILEQIFSPLVVLGQEFLDRLRPLARRTITRHHYHHYRGFLGTQRKLLAKEALPRVKTVLYAYRVTMTGIHLLRTGEVEANLLRLNEEFVLPFLDDLIARKILEKAEMAAEERAFHEARLAELEALLDRAAQESGLPETPDRNAIEDFLVEVRLEKE